MKIEEEIKQQKFQSEHHKALINIIFTGNYINQITRRFLRQFGISPQQYNILRILRGQRPQTATVMTLQDRMLDRMSNASRLIDKLKVKNLVSRTVNKEDRRRVDVKITQKGLSLLEKIEKMDFEKRFNHLNANEAAKLNELLDKFRG